MNESEIKIQDVEGTPEAQAVTDGLRAYNRSQVGDSRHLPLVLSVRGDDGRVVAGLVGDTRWTWLFVSLLWVDESCRGTGLGKNLIATAETEARKRGCRHAYLDTFSFQARPFYEALGYTLFGELEEFPPGQRRYFLRKKLAIE
jgi:GNAT superfamily N-acetyltransferase